MAGALILATLLAAVVMSLGCACAWIVGMLGAHRMHARSELLRRSF